MRQAKFAEERARADLVLCEKDFKRYEVRRGAGGCLLRGFDDSDNFKVIGCAASEEKMIDDSE